MASKSLKFFKFKLDVYDYNSTNFHFNPFSGGFSGDRKNVTVYYFCCCFFLVRTQVEPVNRFSVYDPYKVFSSKNSSFGVATIWDFILRVIFPK